MKAHGIQMEGPFKVEILSTLPAWTSNDEGREVYVQDEERRYYGDGTSWVDYSSGVSSGSSSLESVVITSSRALTEDETSQTLVTNYGMGGATVTTFPARSSRTRFTVLVETQTQDWQLEPPTDEAFVLDGVALAANQHIQLDDNVEDSVLVLRIRTGESAYQWRVLSVVGAHAAVA